MKAETKKLGVKLSKTYTSSEANVVKLKNYLIKCSQKSTL
jgi:hypothetical protein